MQMEQQECGMAALAIVLGHWGRFVPLAELRADCGGTKDPYNLNTLAMVAKDHGFATEVQQVPFSEMGSLSFPCILKVKKEHFVVVEGVGSSGKLYVNDPGAGPKILFFEEGQDCKPFEVITLKPGALFTKVGERPGLWNCIRDRLLKADLWAVLCLVLVHSCLALLYLSYSGFQRMFVDDLFQKTVVIENRATLFLLVLSLVICLVFFLKTVSKIVWRRYKSKLTLLYSANFIWHFLSLPYRYFLERYGSEVITRVKLNEQIASLLAGPFLSLFMQSIFSILFVVLMLWYDVLIGTLAAFAAVFQIVSLVLLFREGTVAQTKLAMCESRVTLRSIDTLQNIESFQEAGSEKFCLDRVEKDYSESMRLTDAIGNVELKFASLNVFFEKIGSGLVLCIGGWHVISGSINLGILAALQILVYQFLRPSSKFLSCGMLLQKLKVDLQKLHKVMINKRRKKKVSTEKADVRWDGKVELRGIAFGYEPKKKPLFSGVHLVIEPGEFVALTGSVGSGKSSFIKIALGLLDPIRGKVFYDEQDLSECRAEDVAAMVGAAFQEPELVMGSVRDNLTFWDSKVTDEMLESALDDACILEEVLARPGQLLAKVKERGENFSRGQRQCLCIARALVKNPSVVFLDHATSAIDPETEEKILENLHLRGVTVLFTTTETSVSPIFDKVMVLDERGCYSADQGSMNFTRQKRLELAEVL